MKKITLISFALLVFLNGSFAQQSGINELGCATVTTQTEIQRVYDFVQNGSALKTTGTVDTIPLSIHIVGRDNGTGAYTLDNLFQVICQLNQHYTPVDLYFTIKWPIEYINSTVYFEHNFQEGQQMMNQYNVANTANVYFVGDPSGACGYFSHGGDAVAIKNNCGGVNSTTLVHEIGHYFGLPHTFYGWEGGVSPANPELVTRSTGANCSFTGDGFCDTDADFQSDRWQCPYTGNMLDANNEPYHPDSSLYMSYSYDACATRFSNQQIGAVHNQINQYRQNLLGTSFSPYSSLDIPVNIYPTDTMFGNLKKITWHKVPGAEYYQVKLYSGNVPALIKQETLTQDTNLVITPALAEGGLYGVKIIPVMGSNVCRTKVLTFNFRYTNATTTLSVTGAQATSASMSINPNPVTENSVNILLQGLATGDYSLALLNLSGQKLIGHELKKISGSQNVSFDLSNLPSGMYFVQLSGNGSRKVEKLLIQK